MESSRELDWTGERLTTSKKNEIVIHHLHRYAISLDLCKGKTVLDIASGEGYGSYLISKAAHEVKGVDISKDTVEFAKIKYQAPNLQFLQGSADQIPLANNSVDVVVSFETLEHHDKHHEMMLEIKRVLKPGGILIMSSPDKLNYTDATGFHNPFHVKELYREEFKKLIAQYFVFSKIYYQNIIYSSVMVAEDGLGNGFTEYSGNFESISSVNSISVPMYNICVASDNNLGELNCASIFDATNILEGILQKESEIYNSKTYKLGYYMTFPLRLIRKIIK